MSSHLETMLCSVVVLMLILTSACFPSSSSSASSAAERISNFDYEPTADLEMQDESVFYRPFSRDQFENDLEKRSYPYNINNWKRAWVDKFWSTVRKKGLTKRRLSAGEILEILRQMSEGRGASQGRLKAVRFGISRKRSEPTSSSSDFYYNELS